MGEKENALGARGKRGRKEKTTVPFFSGDKVLLEMTTFDGLWVDGGRGALTLHGHDAAITIKPLSIPRTAVSYRLQKITVGQEP